MKLRKLIGFLITLLAFTTFTGCGSKDDPAPEGGKTSSLTIEEQKAKMETAANELMSDLQASGVRNVTDIADYASETYNDDNYDCDGVEKWWSDCLDAVTKLNSSDTYSKTFTRLYAASNFTGHFKANTSTKQWDYTPASDLEFIFPDKQGKECTATLTTSGKTKKVYMGESDEYINWREDDFYKNYVEVPEDIKVTFTQGGTTIATMDLSTDLSGMASENFDLTKDSYSAVCKLMVNNFTFEVKQAAYSPTSASVAFSVSKGDKSLLSMTAAAKGAVTDEFTEVGIASVNVDILGEIQIKGDCSNCSKYSGYINDADDNDGNEATFKSDISQANAILDLGLYYNSDTRQASIALEPFEEEYNGYGKYWYSEPVLKFDDGTSYSTFEAFFDKTSFKDVIDNFNKLIGDYQAMID